MFLCRYCKLSNLFRHELFISFNPFISIPLSDQLMSSGSWVTLHNFEIYNLSAVNYDLIFIRVDIYLGPGEVGLQLIYKPLYVIWVTIYTLALPHNNNRRHYLPRSAEKGAYSWFFKPFSLLGSLFTPAALPHNISRGHYYPARFTALFWLVTGPLFTLGFLVFVMTEPAYKRTGMKVLKFFI